MARRLDPSGEGESTKVAARFDAALLAAIDREAQRLSALTGEVCDRSKALRSIVRQHARGQAASRPSASASPAATAAPVLSPSRASEPTEGERNAALRARLRLALGARSMSVRAFCAHHAVVRSTLQRFIGGEDLRVDVLDKIASAVDALESSGDTP